MKNFQAAFDKAKKIAAACDGYAVVAVRGVAATKILMWPTGWALKYQDTKVVDFGVSEVVPELNSGGFYTRTTAVRMNQALQLAGSQWRVRRSQGRFVVNEGNGVERSFINKY
jgi:hypothetical protein